MADPHRCRQTAERRCRSTLCAWRRCRPATGALCATSEESAGENGEGLPLSSSSRRLVSTRILDRSRASEEGIESHVVDPASITTSRRRRRAKTDGIDGEALVRALLAHKARRTSGVRDGEAPTPEEEDRRRLCRERKVLIGEQGPSRQSRQGAAVLTGDIWLPAATPRPAGAAGYAPDRRWSPTTSGSF